MSLYVIIMYCLSPFGFLIIFFSFSLFIVVPTKLNNFTRFVIHGHDLISALTQLYITLGTIPTFLFPCLSGFANGFLSSLGMRLLDQLWIQVAFLSVNAGFSVLLGINRVFSITLGIGKYKQLIMTIFIVQMVCQVIFLFFVGTNLRCGGKEVRQTCLEKLTYEYPEEMYTMRGCDTSFQDSGIMMISLYAALATSIYTIIEIVCVSILIQSIREQTKSSQSTHFLANQRRITSGILYFLIVEIVGFSCPFIVLSGCVILDMGSRTLSDCSFIFICIYPIFGSYYVLMSNKDYRNRITLFELTSRYDYINLIRNIFQRRSLAGVRLPELICRGYF